MTCLTTNNCKRAVQEFPSCFAGIIKFPDTGLFGAAVTLLIEKGSGSSREVSLTTEGDGTLNFEPTTDLASGDADYLNGQAGDVWFTILDSNLDPVTMTDATPTTADCVIINFREPVSTASGTVTLTFEV